MIQRNLNTKLLKLLSYFPVVGIVGPRQVGKTTLVKALSVLLPKPSIYFDLESPETMRVMTENPEWFLSQYESQTVIIDEVQLLLPLFPLLRSLIDRNRVPARFILLGSASPDFLANSSETLAGRIAYVELNPFTQAEALAADITTKNHWLRGGFPDALLAPDGEIWNYWQQNFIKTYIERDLGRMGLSASPLVLNNLLQMLTGVQGSVLVYANLANSLRIDQRTVHKYLDALEHAYLIRRLQPWYVNIGKRLVKTPKFYFRDTGNLHYLCGIDNYEQLAQHNIVGSSWEGYIINQIIAQLKSNIMPYFYRTSNGAELDLVLVKGIEPVASFEIKLSSASSLKKGSTEAIKDVSTKHNYLVTTDGGNFRYRPDWLVCNLSEVLVHLKDLGLLEDITPQNSL